MSEPFERVTDSFAASTGATPMTADEATALLDLARHVAHTSDDRRSAPLVCYLAGQVLAAETSPGERVRRIRGFIELYPEA